MTTTRHPELRFFPASPFEMTFPQGRRLIERKAELAAELHAIAEEMASLHAMTAPVAYRVRYNA